MQAVDYSRVVSKPGTGSSKRRTPVPVESTSSEGAGLAQHAVGFWKAASRRLRDLEDKLANQVIYLSGRCPVRNAALAP